MGGADKKAGQTRMGAVTKARQTTIHRGSNTQNPIWGRRLGTAHRTERRGQKCDREQTCGQSSSIRPKTQNAGHSRRAKNIPN